MATGTVKLKGNLSDIINNNHVISKFVPFLNIKKNKFINLGKTVSKLFYKMYILYDYIH